MTLIEDLKKTQGNITVAMRVLDEIETEIDYQNDYIAQVHKGIIFYDDIAMERSVAILNFCYHLRDIATRYTEIKGE